MRVYYNEFDPKACAWLAELMKAGQIPHGDIDSRSITEVKPADVQGYDQAHFFAGIGGWAYALRLARADAIRVWTGSCPCQPFSVAGKRKGAADSRHIWPVWFKLISACKPGIVFGEQVASAIKFGWLDGVCADLGAEDYTVRADVFGAHSKRAPQLRKRLYWMAYASGRGIEAWLSESRQWKEGYTIQSDDAGDRGDVWGNSIEVAWKDGKTRRIKPGVCLLANGVSGRVGILRGFGNAIVPQCAAAFIEAGIDELASAPAPGGGK